MVPDQLMENSADETSRRHDLFLLGPSGMFAGVDGAASRHGPAPAPGHARSGMPRDCARPSGAPTESRVPPACTSGPVSPPLPAGFPDLAGSRDTGRGFGGVPGPHRKRGAGCPGGTRTSVLPSSPGARTAADRVLPAGTLPADDFPPHVSRPVPETAGAGPAPGASRVPDAFRGSAGQGCPDGARGCPGRESGTRGAGPGTGAFSPGARLPGSASAARVLQGPSGPPVPAFSRQPGRQVREAFRVRTELSDGTPHVPASAGNAPVPREPAARPDSWHNLPNLSF
jgi:hypothetical protein